MFNGYKNIKKIYKKCTKQCIKLIQDYKFIITGILSVGEHYTVQNSKKDSEYVKTLKTGRIYLKIDFWYF